MRFPYGFVILTFPKLQILGETVEKVKREHFSCPRLWQNQPLTNCEKPQNHGFDGFSTVSEAIIKTAQSRESYGD